MIELLSILGIPLLVDFLLGFFNRASDPRTGIVSTIVDCDLRMSIEEIVDARCPQEAFLNATHQVSDMSASPNGNGTWTLKYTLEPTQ